MNQLYLRHANAAVLGDTRLPGDRNTFSPELARVGGRTELATISRPRRRNAARRRRQNKNKHHHGGNRFRMGAMTGQFSTMGLLALAAAGVGAYLLFKKG